MGTVSLLQNNEEYGIGFLTFREKRDRRRSVHDMLTCVPKDHTPAGEHHAIFLRENQHQIPASIAKSGVTTLLFPSGGNEAAAYPLVRCLFRRSGGKKWWQFWRDYDTSTRWELGWIHPQRPNLFGAETAVVCVK